MRKPLHMKPKSLDEHCEYVSELARLSFYFAYMLKTKLPKKSLSEILRQHTPLYFHVFDYPADKPRAEFAACEAEHAEEFEEKMFCRLKDSIMKRAKERYHSSVGIQVPSGWNCGSLKYDPPDFNFHDGKWCIVHIANAVAPDSIFTDPNYLPKCFAQLIHESEKEYGYNELYIGSWLNDKNEWLAIFPPEWQANLSPKKTELPSWHTGHWGQLITARGTFNYKGGEFLRKNGYLKYFTRNSHCSYEVMRKHLGI